MDSPVTRRAKRKKSRDAEIRPSRSRSYHRGSVDEVNPESDSGSACDPSPSQDPVHEFKFPTGAIQGAPFALLLDGWSDKFRAQFKTFRSQFSHQVVLATAIDNGTDVELDVIRRILFESSNESFAILHTHPMQLSDALAKLLELGLQTRVTAFGPMKTASW